MVIICLRLFTAPATRRAARQIVTNRAETGTQCTTHLAGQQAKAGSYDGLLHDTATVTPRRANASAVRLGRRDIDGLILCAEHFGGAQNFHDLFDGRPAGRPERDRGRRVIVR